jgi:hypothetical protein
VNSNSVTLEGLPANTDLRAFSHWATALNTGILLAHTQLSILLSKVIYVELD